MSEPTNGDGEPGLVVLLDDPAMPDARRLVSAVAEHGAACTIDASTLASLEVETDGEWMEARLDGVALRPSAVLVWRLPTVCDHPRRDELMADPIARSHHQRQWSSMLHGLLLAWEIGGVPIVNGASVGRWDEKTAQILVAASVGFRTPRTLQSARPGSIRSFLDAQGGGVTKAFVPFHSYDPATSRATRQLTRELSSDGVDARSERAVPTAALYQPLVRASSELRVVVVGDQTFAARFDRNLLDHVDSRHQEPAFVPAEPYDVPPSLARRCRDLLDRCGLDMAVIDLLVGDDGEPVFLDLNPTGIFDWIACRFGLAIYPAVAELLVGLPRSRAA